MQQISITSAAHCTCPSPCCDWDLFYLTPPNGKFFIGVPASSKAFPTDAGQLWAIIRLAWPCPSPPAVPRLCQCVLGWLQCSWQVRHPDQPHLGLNVLQLLPIPKNHPCQGFPQSCPSPSPKGAPGGSHNPCSPPVSQLEQLELGVPRSGLRWSVQLMDLLFQPAHTLLPPRQLIPVLSSLTCHRDPV